MNVQTVSVKFYFIKSVSIPARDKSHRLLRFIPHIKTHPEITFVTAEIPLNIPFDSTF